MSKFLDSIGLQYFINKIKTLIDTKADKTQLVKSNWTETETTYLSYIENKPPISKGSSDYSIIEGDLSNNIASNSNTHAEGARTAASGTNSHAEGLNTVAGGSSAHAEGFYSRATGNYSHAEGSWNSATGISAHAEGNNNTSSGMYSHAEGEGTTSVGKSQHVFGEYNVSDPSSVTDGTTRGTYVEIVGNGSSNAKSNARTLDWNGNETLAGKLTVGAGPTSAMDVATKQYVDNKTSSNAYAIAVFKYGSSSDSWSIDFDSSYPPNEDVDSYPAWLEMCKDSGYLIIAKTSNNSILDGNIFILTKYYQTDNYGTPEPHFEFSTVTEDGFVYTIHYDNTDNGGLLKSSIWVSKNRIPDQSELSYRIGIYTSGTSYDLQDSIQDLIDMYNNGVSLYCVLDDLNIYQLSHCPTQMPTGGVSATMQFIRIDLYTWTIYGLSIEFESDSNYNILVTNKLL